jgi:NtrC-family two-component system sensor histidine kinase KinB
MSAVVLVLRDVTKLKQLDRLKSEFVMAASHELRTPLTSMGMSLDLLIENAKNKLNEKEQQLLWVAHEEVERLKALISNLLDLSKIESGKLELDMQLVSAQTLCQKAVAVMKLQADEKNIELSVKLPDGLPDVRADANRITWVLINLISNALRYTAGGGYIKVMVEQAGAQLHLSVRDNGAGIPYEFQSKIFDKFVQIKTDKTVGGSGLGLAISKEIVRAHGGTIWVESTPGKGSTFTFTLPAVGKPFTGE